MSSPPPIGSRSAARRNDEDVEQRELRRTAAGDVHDRRDEQQIVDASDRRGSSSDPAVAPRRPRCMPPR